MVVDLDGADGLAGPHLLGVFLYDHYLRLRLWFLNVCGDVGVDETQRTLPRVVDLQQLLLRYLLILSLTFITSLHLHLLHTEMLLQLPRIRTLLPPNQIQMRVTLMLTHLLLLVTAQNGLAAAGSPISQDILHVALMVSS